MPMSSINIIEDSFRIFVYGQGAIFLGFLKTIKGKDGQVRVAKSVREKIFDIFDANQGKSFDIFVDTCGLEVQPKIASRARKIYAEVAAHAQAGKICASGHRMFYRTVVDFISHSSGKDISWHDSPAVAMACLGKSDAFPHSP